MKIFVIGFHKTGTTTLETALIMLGYNVYRPAKFLLPAIQSENFEAVWQVVEQYDAFQDNPWPLLYRELDQHYPGSKFILTQRHPQKWLASMINHCGKKSNEMRSWIYGEGHGSPVGSEQVYLDRMQRHNTDVLDYFKERPVDLLVMDISQGDGWNKLCPFLGLDFPVQSFPHSNQRNYSPLARALRAVGIKKRHKAYRNTPSER